MELDEYSAYDLVHEISRRAQTLSLRRKRGNVIKYTVHIGELLSGKPYALSIYSGRSKFDVDADTFENV